MMDRKWTPGPWQVRYTQGETQLIMGDGEIHMCDMTYYPWVPENDADWNLISAAPDLYEALVITLDHAMLHLPHLKDGFSVFDTARAALAKAEGRQP